MTTAVTRVEEISRIHRDTDARRLAVETYGDMLSLLSGLTAAEWEAPTECEPWTVADIVRHLVGAAAAHASVREQIRQVRYGAKHRSEFGGSDLDAMNDLQVTDHLALDPAALVARLSELAPRAVRGRMRAPGLVRRISLDSPAGGSSAPGLPSRFSIGELFDVVLTRDVWLHRIDICRAIGKEPTLGTTDRRVVEDVVAEWAARCAPDVELTLTGPAGGRFVAGDGSGALEIDAVELCRVLSGRAEHPGPWMDVRLLF